MYKNLNLEQRKAVDAVDGPLLVLAGPGTGKTQLLSARVANILRKTDTLPQSILCLTFTDAAAMNMRERLNSMIGDAAYDVHINTYHSFASDVILTYPDYFETINMETGEDTRMERSINELGQLEITKNIVDSLPFTDPLRSSRHFLRSLISTISDLKQANVSAKELRKIATDNAEVCAKLSPRIQEIYGAVKMMPRKVDAANDLFNDILELLLTSSKNIASIASADLTQALEKSKEQNSTKPLTVWKNNWLQKDESDQWTFTDPELSDRMLSLAKIYERYQEALDRTNQYDFNDMILRTLAALQSKPELIFNLQERFQYILLDEFQDTNAVQFELVRSLADHPVHEGRPNVMAVGDDDQGIFAFQGAEIGNMVKFLSTFRDVNIINLTKNYRSHPDILHVAHNIANQIESRLHHNLDGISKNIVAAAKSLPDVAHIARHEFSSQAAEYGWIAETISQKINSGVPPHEIAILAPKHAILESIVPFLNKHKIPVAYEKRENIFETPIIQSILLISEFLIAAQSRNMPIMDELLPQVLSIDFWQVPTETIWKINWEHSAKHQEDNKRWTERALENKQLSNMIKFLLQLGNNSTSYGLELTLDYITGAKPLMYKEDSYTSPLKSFYFSDEKLNSSSLEFYEAISHLSVIRSNLREQQASQDSKLGIDSLINLYRTYQEAELPLINSHPIAQSHSAVKLQTVYKAKGLEYEYVFLPCMHDNVWGSSVKGGSNKLKLPVNLKFIRHESSGDDNLRRLLFVAITRAKHGLIATSHAQNESGKKHLPVKFMQESDDGTSRLSAVLPNKYQQVVLTQRQPDVLRLDVDTLWHSRHSELTIQLKSLLSERLRRYIMSPTHLNTFTNIEYSGPYKFLLGTLLKFPEAPSPDSTYGDALHRALEHYQKSWLTGINMNFEQTYDIFGKRMERGFMNEADKKIYFDRGHRALKSYLNNCPERLHQSAEIEIDFRREGCTYDEAILTGKIDRLEVNKKNKTLRIIDFKSGTPSTKWGSTSKFIAYKQQLYFYILLAETSYTYRDYVVESAALEFIEPLSNGNCAAALELKFNQSEYDEFKLLVKKVWQHIMDLDLPDISSYPANAKGMRSFINFLIK
ncbi:MAG: ATP-dependent helicase [bacterium]|nr:ATP-dependent helicase [bacterium]